MNTSKALFSALLALTLMGQMTTSFAGEVTGKVVAVFHETVQLPNKKWADKVSVTVADCNASNRFVTTHYTPGRVSEDNTLAFNMRHLTTAARSTEQRNQYMNVVNGHATIKFDEQSKAIQKTTVWGYNWACGQNLDSGANSQMTKAPTQAPTGQPAAMPQEQQPAAAASSNPLKKMNKLRRFGGF